MKFLFPIGRILFAFLFLGAAPRHFSHEGIAHASDLGVPLPNVLVPISGVLAVTGGLSIALGYRTRLGAWLIVTFLIPVTFLMHAFWKFHDPAAIHIQSAMFWKNIALLGAAFLMTQFGAGAVSFDQGQAMGAPTENAPHRDLA